MKPISMFELLGNLLQRFVDGTRTASLHPSPSEESWDAANTSSTLVSSEIWHYYEMGFHGPQELKEPDDKWKSCSADQWLSTGAILPSGDVCQCCGVVLVVTVVERCYWCFIVLWHDALKQNKTDPAIKAGGKLNMEGSEFIDGICLDVAS